MDKQTDRIHSDIDRQMTISIIVSMVVTLLVSASLWSEALAQSLSYWLGAMLSISVIRLGLLYPRQQSSTREQLQWFLTALAGLGWGIAAPLFLPLIDSHQQILLLLVLLGIVATSSNAYAGRMPLFYAFMLTSLTPVAAWLLSRDDRTFITLGVICLLYMLALSLFARRSTALLRITAAHNEQLQTEIRERVRQHRHLELQRAILNAIANHCAPLPELLTTIVHLVEAQREGMLASILLLDDDGKHLHAGAAPSLPEAWNQAIDGAMIGPEAGSCGTAAFRNERVIVEDIATNPLWSNYRDGALAFELKACWSEPIRSADGRVLGTFAMYYHAPCSPTEGDIELIESVASLTSIAIENYRRKEQLESSQHHEAELAAIVEYSSDMVYAHDLEGTILTANATCMRNFGDQIIGKNISEIIAPEDAARAVSMMTTQKREQGANTVYELTVIDLHGRKRTLEVNSSLVTRDGTVVAVQGVARDITRRKRAEARLQLLQQAIHASDESIMILDAEGHIEFANPAAVRMYRLPLEQLLGSPAACVRNGEVGDEIYRDIIATSRDGHNWQGNIQLQETGRLIGRRVSPVLDEAGILHHQVCIDRDITEEHRRNQQLEHTQRLESLGILAGGIAHDFNNLLTAIMGNAAMAERSLDDTSTAKPFIMRIEESSQRAADLCRQMLAYSGKGQFIVKPINLSELISEMTRLMEVSIDKNVTLRYDLSHSIPLIEADTAQMQQVILNLITNANEAIGSKNGMISFTTGVMHLDRAYLDRTLTHETLREGEYVYMEVADNGCGMSSSTMEKMFDPFFTTKFTGRGLGMSAMLGIVRGHHGIIRVYSEPGRGTTFKILIPATTKKALPSAGTVNHHWHAHGTVLVVDDEESIRDVASIMLQDMGFDTITANNGEEAVEIYRTQQHAIVAVLLDMTMPKMDGKACLAELLCINPDIRVILSSGYTREDTDDQFPSGLLASFIQKPYTPESLQQTMRQSLSS
ncbi:PAS domain S-box protein [Mariprofundus erugo]|uniref:hybrid sensor histidine kinase/response regulator n=1 Tax=Mariprofundus erugo TaxID=2528639 RepID=UPI0010FD8D95|nr:PAS domain S-box protein [Mariprofundus erugo]TLS78433.1 PAS domain S-box protein [Mariprofundus erugo]